MAALHDVTDAATATAYSLGQQRAVTAWNIVFAVVLVMWAFGWAGGKALVEQSYEDAKDKVADQKVQRAATRETKRASGNGPFRVSTGAATPSHATNPNRTQADSIARETDVEQRLRTLPGATRPNTVALISPKGGVGSSSPGHRKL